MGLTISSLFTSLSSLVRWSKDQDVRILMLGLDSAGKVCLVSNGMNSVSSGLVLSFVDDNPVPVTGEKCSEYMQFIF